MIAHASRHSASAGLPRSSMLFAATVTAMIAARVAVMALDWSVF